MAFNKLKHSFLQSSFYRAIFLIKKNPLNCLYMLILDFIFLALILFIGKYTGSLIPQDPQQLIGLFKTKAALILFAFAYPIVYYLLIILIYSFIKLTILNLIRSLHEKSRFSLDKFGKFYWLNIRILSIFAFAGLLLLLILNLVLTKDFLKYFIMILAIPFLFFLYSILSISSVIFIKSSGKGIIKKSFKVSFSKLREYGMFVIWDASLILIYLILYNLIHFIFRVFIFSNNELLSAYGEIYLAIFNVISLIVFYFIIAFNRIYFYERIGQNVL